MIHNVDLAHPLTDHPIWKDVAGVWLPCGNTSGGDKLIDLGPYGNHGQLMNGPKWIGTERGVGLDMPYGQCIALGNPPALNIGTQPFSIVVTLLPFLGYPGHRAMAGKSFSSWGSTGWVLQRYNDDMSRFIIGNDGYYQVLYDSYPGNQHIQIAATRDGQTQHLFHDASEHVYGYADPRIAGDLTNSQDFYLGQVPGWGYVQSLFASAFLLTRPVKAAEVAFFYEQSLRDYPDLIRREPTRSWFLPLSLAKPKGGYIPPEIWWYFQALKETTKPTYVQADFRADTNRLFCRSQANRTEEQVPTNALSYRGDYQ